jgi:hypothetical protein
MPTKPPGSNPRRLSRIWSRPLPFRPTGCAARLPCPAHVLGMPTQFHIPQWTSSEAARHVPQMAEIILYVAKARDGQGLTDDEIGRVGEGRGIVYTTRFPSPLIKPDVRISRIRLSDWLHGRLTT